VVVAPMIAWYIHAFDLWKIYGNTFGVFGGRVKGAWLGAHGPRWNVLENTLGSRLIWEIATPVGLPLLIVGFFRRPPGRNYVLYWWIFAFALTIPALPAGHNGHDYYQLPMMPAVAALMAYGLVRFLDAGFVPKPVFALVALGIIGLSAFQLRHMVFVSQWQRDRIAFGHRVASLVRPDSLIVFAYPQSYTPIWYSHRTSDGDLIEGDPIDFYNSHRKGWSLSTSQTSPEMLEKLRRHGARYFATFFPQNLLSDSPRMGGLLAGGYKSLEVTTQWAIYEIPAGGK